jgi:ATP-dependent Lon protease
MNSTIPIFPLNLVVFPFSKVPLHIFEERYKKMIGKCLKEKSGFGIVSIIKKRISGIGSYVEVINVLKKYDTGELDIIVKGTKRFRIVSKTKNTDGYLLADIEEYFDISSDYDEKLLEDLRNNFKAIIEKINFKLDDAYWESYEKAKFKSYKIAEKSGLSLELQQKLITLQNENDRIDFLLNHLEKLDKRISDSLATGAIIMGDGFL